MSFFQSSNGRSFAAMHTVIINSKAKQVASTWDELGPVQVKRLMPTLYHRYTDLNQQRVEVLEILLGLSRPFSLRLTPVQWLEIFWLADFLLNQPVTLTTQLLPRVRPGRWPIAWYYGPDDALSNLSFLEFAFADAYFMAYAQIGEEKWLNLLIGTLYRPQCTRYRPRATDYNGDRRQAFNEHLIELHTARLAKLPSAIKLLIFTWYRGCRHALEQRYQLVFTPSSQEQVRSHADGWAYVLREMSGQAFGNFDETGKQYIDIVLSKMNDDIARAEELRRQQEAQQRATT